MSIVMTFKLRDSGIISNLPKWNARIYKGEKFLFTTEEFFGDTEEEARLKARKFLKQIAAPDYLTAMAALKPAPVKAEGVDSSDGHHFAGKVWLHHPQQGFKRVAPNEVDGMLGWGWVRRGPRSKV